MTAENSDAAVPFVKHEVSFKPPGPNDTMSVTLVFKSGAIVVLDKVSCYHTTFYGGIADPMCSGYVFTRNDEPVVWAFNDKGESNSYVASENKTCPFTPNTLVDAIIFNNV